MEQHRGKKITWCLFYISSCLLGIRDASHHCKGEGRGVIVIVNNVSRGSKSPFLVELEFGNVGFWGKQEYPEKNLWLLWTEKKWMVFLSCNMWLYARVILACTGINDYNTPRDWLPKGKSTIKVLKQMIYVQRSTQLTKVTHETPQNSSSVFASVLKQARNSDAYAASSTLKTKQDLKLIH